MYPKLKRSFDLLFVIASSIVWFPVLIFVALLVRVRLGSPIIFSQQRPGWHGHPFTIYKFRTMTTEYDENGALLPDNLRLTRFGRFLRSTSLDELPEFWNVLRGDMSLVGPRPLLMSYLEYYSPEQMRRHDVRPGITGWAQINGRNAISWEKKFMLDIWYIDNISPWLDLAIIGKTVLQVFRRENINHTGQATTKKFTGNLP